jgi:hypothetical protein
MALCRWGYRANDRNRCRDLGDRVETHVMDLRLTITAYSGLAAPPVAVVPGKAAPNPMKSQDGKRPALRLIKGDG